MPNVIRLEIVVDDKGTPQIRTFTQSVEELGKKAGVAAGGQVKLAEATQETSTAQRSALESGASLGTIYSALNMHVGGLVGRYGSLLLRLGPVGLAIGAATATASSSISAFSRLAEQTRELAFLSGGSVIEVSKLVSGLDDLGVTTDTVQTGLAFFSRAIEAGSPALNRLGISTRDASGQQKTALALFYESIDALGGVRSEVERNSLAQQLFGRGWMQMIHVIELGSASVRALGEENARTGKIMTEGGIQAAFAYQQALRDLGNVLGGITITLGSDVIPTLTEFFRILGPVAADTGRIFVGIFQEVDSALLLAGAAAAAFIKPFAFLTDLVGLSRGALDAWSRARDVAYGASLDLAAKGLENLTLQHRALQQSIHQAAAAPALPAPETLAELERRLKLENDLIKLRASAEAAEAVTLEEQLLAAISAVNAARQAELNSLQIAAKKEGMLEAEAAQRRVAVHRLADAQIARLRREFDEKQLDALAKRSADELAALAAFGEARAEDARKLEEELTKISEAESEKRLQAAIEAAMQQAHEVGDIEVAGIVDAERIAREIREREAAEIQRIRERTLAFQLAQLGEEEEAIRRAANAGIITRQDEARALAELTIREFGLRQTERERDLEREREAARMRLFSGNDYFGKVRAGLELHFRDWRSTNDKILEITKDFSGAAVRSLDDFYFIVVKGRFEELENIAESFGNALLRIGTQEMARGTLNMLGLGGGFLSGLFPQNFLNPFSIGSGAFLGFLQRGIWQVPDLPGREWAVLHPGEMVLPPEVAAAVRAMGGIFGFGPSSGMQPPAIGGEASGQFERGPVTDIERAWADAYDTIAQFGTPTDIAAAIGRSLGHVVNIGVMGARIAQGGPLAIPGALSTAVQVADFLNARQFAEAARIGLMAGFGPAAAMPSLGASLTAAEAASVVGSGGGGYGGSVGGGGFGPGNFGGATGSDLGMFQRGGLFETRGATRMIVGEAGAETVAIVRNPRDLPERGIGGISLTINIDARGSLADARELTALVRERVYPEIVQLLRLRHGPGWSQ